MAYMGYSLRAMHRKFRIRGDNGSDVPIVGNIPLRKNLHQALLRNSDKDARHRDKSKTLPARVVAFTPSTVFLNFF